MEEGGCRLTRVSEFRRGMETAAGGGGGGGGLTMRIEIRILSRRLRSPELLLLLLPLIRVCSSWNHKHQESTGKHVKPEIYQSSEAEKVKEKVNPTQMNWVYW